jgi:hypothetical protein
MSVPWSRVGGQIAKNFAKWNAPTVAAKPNVPYARLTSLQKIKVEMTNKDVWPFFVGW